DVNLTRIFPHLRSDHIGGALMIGDSNRRGKASHIRVVYSRRVCLHVLALLLRRECAALRFFFAAAGAPSQDRERREDACLSVRHWSCVPSCLLRGDRRLFWVDLS